MDNERKMSQEQALLQRQQSESLEWVKDDSITKMQIVSIERLSAELWRNPEKSSWYFTSGEIDYCRSRMSSLAGRLGAKLAIMSMFGPGLLFQEIEIVSSPIEKPHLQLTGEAEKRQKDIGLNQLAVSLAHDEGIAAAFIVGTSADERPIHIGIDIASVARIEDLHKKHKERFLRRTYTEKEIKEAEGNNIDLGVKWAGKEAVAKALGTGVWREGVAWTDIEILETARGESSVSLSGAAALAAEKRNLSEWRINTLPDPKTPIAMVIGYGQLDTD